MTHAYASQSFVAASARLDDACSWLQSLGIQYSKTRVGRYKALFASLARHQLANTLPSFYDEYSFEALVNAAHEVAEIVRIYEGLSQVADASLTSRLQAAIKGHELYVLDKEDRSGRDFSLELSTAAKFARAGLPVDFGHAADLRTQYGPFTFFVECKRLKSARKVPERVKNGLNQLHGRYRKSESPTTSRGLLVLATSKLVNADLGLLEADTHEHLGEKAFAHNRAFIETHRHHWQSGKDNRTLGVAVVFDTPGIVGSQKLLVTCHEVAMNNAVPVNTPDYHLLLRIAHEVFPKRA